MIRTTNLIIHTDKIDYSVLESKFKLVAYRLKRYDFSQDKNKYAKLINEYKDILERPFYFHSTAGPATFYVLYEKNQTPQTLEFKGLGERSVPVEVSFKDVELHVLVKLMMSAFFYYKPNGEVVIPEKEERVCQSTFYVFGKYKGNIVGVRLGLGEDYIHHIDENPDKDFNIIPTVSTFIKQDIKKLKTYYEKRGAENVEEIVASHLKINPYYVKFEKGDTSYFRQIKPGRVTKTKNVFKEADKRDRENLDIPAKSHLDWHSNAKTRWRNAVGFMIYNFQKKFVVFLNEHKISVSAKRHDGEIALEFQEFKTQVPKTNQRHRVKKGTGYINGYGETGLPLKEIGTVYVFDNRLGKSENIPALQEYIALFTKHYAEKFGLTFKPTTEDEITGNPDVPILLIQDYDKDDFKFDNGKPRGLLAKEGFDDPKKKFYKTFKGNPKQTISVNPNDVTDYHNAPDYLNYEVIDNDETEQWRAFDIKCKVCFNELFLKDLIIKQKPIMSAERDYALPCFPECEGLKDYAFIAYETLLYIEKDTLNFISFKTPEGKAQRNQFLSERFGITWRDIEKKYFKKYEQYKKFSEQNAEDIDKLLKKACFIIGKSLVIEIDTLQERVIYDYDLIEQTYNSGLKSARKKEHITGYQGVWFSEPERKYIVGSPDGMKRTPQHNAHIVRQFDVYEGEERFGKNEFEMFLETMAVKFVKNEQYTVYPYFFDLIRLHWENQD